MNEKNRFYEISTITAGKYSRYRKTDLNTAFYTLRDCINSGLYNEIYFDVYEKDATNKYLYNGVCFLPAGNGFIKCTKRAKWYFARFKKWIDEHGTTKNIEFLQGVYCAFNTQKGANT